MARKNVSSNRNSETFVRDRSIDRVVESKRQLADHGNFIHYRDRIYDYKMGEAAVKLLNLLGVTSMIYAFIANIQMQPFISICIAAVSLVFGVFKVLKMREDWLFRRSERMEREHDFKKKRQ